MDDVDAPDHLVADPVAIPSADPSRRSRTLGECFRVFVRRPSPWLILAAVLLAAAARIAIGELSWRDAAAVALLLASAPFIEWLIHVYVLHARPFHLGGRTIELPNAREHRLHHAEPSDPHWVVIPLRVLPLFLALLALLAAIETLPLHLLAGGSWLPIAATATLVSFLFVGAYEWTHFLIHSPYRPRSRSYRAIHRNHRLHHFKNEEFWFGVTSTIGDRVIGTAPDQREVPRSATARRLHGEA